MSRLRGQILLHWWSSDFAKACFTVWFGCIRILIWMGITTRFSCGTRARGGFLRRGVSQVGTLGQADEWMLL